MGLYGMTVIYVMRGIPVLTHVHSLPRFVKYDNLYVKKWCTDYAECPYSRSIFQRRTNVERAVLWPI